MQFDCITKLIDLPDVRVIDFVSNEKDLVLIAEYLKDFITCPDCGKKLTKVLDRRTQWVKDSPILGKRTLIRLEKKRYYCCCTGAKKAHSEQYSSIKPYARKTKRFGKYIFNQANVGLDFSNIASNLSVSYTTIMNAVYAKVDGQHRRSKNRKLKYR